MTKGGDTVHCKYSIDNKSACTVFVKGKSEFFFAKSSVFLCMDTWTQTYVKEGQNCVAPRQTHESVTKGYTKKWTMHSEFQLRKLNYNF